MLLATMSAVMQSHQATKTAPARMWLMDKVDIEWE